MFALTATVRWLTLNGILLVRQKKKNLTLYLLIKSSVLGRRVKRRMTNALSTSLVKTGQISYC